MRRRKKNARMVVKSHHKSLCGAQASSPTLTTHEYYKATRPVRNVKPDEIANERVFEAACSIANIFPTVRQLSKFRRKTGLAFSHVRAAKAAIKVGDDAS